MAEPFYHLKKPIELKENDVIQIKLSASLVGEKYIWRWNTKFISEGKEVAAFKQNSHQGDIFSLETLKKQEKNYAPELTSQGEATLCVLKLMDGGHSLEQISTEIEKKFPQFI